MNAVRTTNEIGGEFFITVDPTVKKVTAMATDPNLGRQQIAAGNASIAEKNRKFLENVVVWPGPNDRGWINMYVMRTPPWYIGWPFRDVDAFIKRIRWVNSTGNFTDVKVCMSQQSECTTNRQGKPKAVATPANATWLRSVWIDCGNQYGSVRDAWAAIRAFRHKVGLPFPSAVVKSDAGLQVYWISDRPLILREWQPYASGLEALVLREGLKCRASFTSNSTGLLPVPGRMNPRCMPPQLAEVVHLGRQYDFSNALSVLPTAAIDAEVSRLLCRRRKSRRVSGDPK
jgi:hypothetical protein